MAAEHVDDFRGPLRADALAEIYAGRHEKVPPSVLREAIHFLKYSYAGGCAPRGGRPAGGREDGHAAGMQESDLWGGTGPPSFACHPVSRVQCTALSPRSSPRPVHWTSSAAPPGPLTPKRSAAPYFCMHSTARVCKHSGVRTARGGLLSILPVRSSGKFIKHRPPPACVPASLCTSAGGF